MENEREMEIGIWELSKRNIHQANKDSSTNKRKWQVKRMLKCNR